QSTDEDTPTAAIAFFIGEVESSAGSLTLTGHSLNQGLVPDGNIVFGGSGPNRTLTLMPAANQSGTATITITVADPDGASAGRFSIRHGRDYSYRDRQRRRRRERNFRAHRELRAAAPVRVQLNAEQWSVSLALDWLTLAEHGHSGFVGPHRLAARIYQHRSDKHNRVDRHLRDQQRIAFLPRGPVDH